MVQNRYQAVYIMFVMRIPPYLLLIIISTLCIFSSCNTSPNIDKLNQAENIMETYPDSALKILTGLNNSNLNSAKEKARYAILMSMAIDKNYIDTTTFEILQPAIDYYLNSGNPDEKMKTYYYQGCIYQNNGDLDKALDSYLKALDNSTGYTDSLAMARTYEAIGYLYFEFYDFNSYIENYKTASNIYKALSKKEFEFDCYLNLLNGAVITKNRALADSTVRLLKEFDTIDSLEQQRLKRNMLSYYTTFGSKKELTDLLEREGDYSNINIEGILNLALVHHKVGNNAQALNLLKFVSEQKTSYDTLKHQAITVSVLEDMNDYKSALDAYKRFVDTSDSVNSLKFNEKIKEINEKHEFVLKTEQEANRKSKIIFICIIGIIILLMGLSILLLLYRSNRIQKNLVIQQSKTIEADNAKLKTEKELALEQTRNAELEAENLIHRIEELETESESLRNLLNTPEDIPQEVRNAIQTRIEMLNGLLASYITANDQYGRPYDEWVREITQDTEKFMNSNRLAFQASHPKFIKYFEDHNLTVSEINYVCLYALGLRGVEVGKYMKKRSHVNISSAIRKKLGIDKHETNIGIYVRRLLKNL